MALSRLAGKLRIPAAAALRTVPGSRVPPEGASRFVSQDGFSPSIRLRETEKRSVLAELGETNPQPFSNLSVPGSI